MSDIDRLRWRLRDLETLRQAHLDNAEDAHARARAAAAQRDNPPEPMFAFEHQQRIDAQVADLTRSAVRNRRDAEKTLAEIRGLEATLRHRTRTER